MNHFKYSCNFYYFRMILPVNITYFLRMCKYYGKHFLYVNVVSFQYVICKIVCFPYI